MYFFAPPEPQGTHLDIEKEKDFKEHLMCNHNLSER